MKKNILVSFLLIVLLSFNVVNCFAYIDDMKTYYVDGNIVACLDSGNCFLLKADPYCDDYNNYQKLNTFIDSTSNPALGLLFVFLIIFCPIGLALLYEMREINELQKLKDSKNTK